MNLLRPKKIYLLLLLLLMSCQSFAQSVGVTSWKLRTTKAGWQFTLNLTASPQFHVFSLHKPERIVLDINKVSSYSSFSSVNLSSTPIKKIRTAYHANKMFRIVFDVKYPVKYLVSKVKISNSGRYQLMVHLARSYKAPLGFKWPDQNSAFRDHSQPKHHSKTVSKIVQRARDVIIVIDPGHGGKDPGATGRGGTHEKTIVLAISKYLAKLINKTKGFKAHLTRTGDYYLTLRQRIKIARKDKADMFIAIHADAFLNNKAQGASVFALSQRGATSEAARWLAEKENQSELMGGVDLSDKSRILKSVLIDLSQTASTKSSLKIGKDIIHFLRYVAKLHHSRVEQAAFVVLKSPDIPSLLVETGFLSNPIEERRLKTRHYQHKIAQALASGIARFFKKYPPRNTWLAQIKVHPTAAVKSYVVARGDTLSQITRRFGVSARRVKKLNHLKADRIYVGQKLLFTKT